MMVTTQAQINLEQALDREMNEAKIYLQRGLVQMALGRYDGATEDFDRAIDLDPTSADAYFSRGTVRFRLDDQQGATEDLHQAADLYIDQGKPEAANQALQVLGEETDDAWTDFEN
ncbi:tetratricopeptide repeat protein [Egbenema bharatensis]|uniref:tetratricopeptide repeat protein n=1 Tax=Egbenema bharatensis TaxID=3463334 RepID=UPI003A85DFC4